MFVIKLGKWKYRYQIRSLITTANHSLPALIHFSIKVKEPNAF